MQKDRKKSSYCAINETLDICAVLNNLQSISIYIPVCMYINIHDIIRYLVEHYIYILYILYHIHVYYM